MAPTSKKPKTFIRRKRNNNLTIAQKIFILNAIKDGCKIKNIAQDFNIHKSTITKIVKQEQDIRMFAIDSPYNSNIRKSMKFLKMYRLEMELIKCLHNIRQMQQSITNEKLMLQAKILHKSIDRNIKCTFSRGWVDKFKN